ncbi:HNH endonuclease signature motif containing protein [Morganella morganii]|uniref:HNH endonuclease signature motif containing protein n=1 Tax=Morganella morganii TaxID=582 RepID=UPI001BDA5A79|nr:HNH endonuclease signature motif containing protein [Morganella morganii]EKU5843255.1 HNH endonuclease [Morganella morganii]MBT0403223.1 HNH endonuclease [Morganella morganii subsp. morganii]
MEFKAAFSWRSDDMPETTDAVVYVSRCGTVVKTGSYKHWNKKNQNYSTRKERVYRQSTNRGKDAKSENGPYGKYKHVWIRDRWYQVHRLVAIAWICNPEGKPQVNHINGVKSDNRADNLEWATNLENRRHAGETLPRNTPRGEQVNTAKLTALDVIDIRERLKTPYKGICRDLAVEFGVAKSTITWIKKGEVWKHV